MKIVLSDTARAVHQAMLELQEKPMGPSLREIADQVPALLGRRTLCGYYVRLLVDAGYVTEIDRPTGKYIAIEVEDEGSSDPV